MGKHAVKKSLKKGIGAGFKKRKRSYIIGLIVLWIVLALTIGAIVYLTLEKPGSKKVTVATVAVTKGMNSTDIAELLEKEKIISNSFTFRIYASLNNIDDRFLPGEYRLSSDMTYEEIGGKLTAGPKKRMLNVVIPEGFTLTEINSRLAEEFGRDPGEFQSVTEGAEINDYDFTLLPVGARNLEGYVFPKTYTFDETTDPKKVIGRMLYQFEIETKSLDWSLAQQKGLSKNEIITIASFIEKEAKVPEERPLMAAVIYNRLAIGMPLQIDATIQYVLPERKTVLTEQDTKINSPYNTYLNTGLTPGPIANPGIDSIKAALAPAQVDYLYYILTSPDGHHTFTNNYNDFMAAKRQMNR